MADPLSHDPRDWREQVRDAVRADISRRLGLRRTPDEKDSDPGDLTEVYARTELALEAAGWSYPGPAERLLLRRVVDAVAPVLALRYRREGRLQTDNAVTWNTLDVTEAEELDRLYAERCAGEQWGARAGLELADRATALAAAVLELVDRTAYATAPPDDLLTDRRAFHAALAELRAERATFTPKEADDDPADDR